MQSQAAFPPSLRLVPPKSGSFSRNIFRAVAAPLERLLSLDKVDAIYQGLSRETDLREFLAESMRAFGFSYQAEAEALARIPASGPLIVVCNHPFGGIEGLALAHMLLGARPDVKIMANHLLGRIKELKDIFLLVDPFGGKQSASRNVSTLKQSLVWLKQGGCIGIFPAGEVASLDLKKRRVAEPAWSETAARLAAKTGAHVLPVFFAGANGPLFQTAGLIHPKLRTMLLPREMVNKRNKCVDVKIGNPISPKRLSRFAGQSEVTEHLRLRTQLLGAKSAKPGRSRKLFPLKPAQRAQSIISPVAPEALEAEISRLPQTSRLLKNGEFDVLLAKAWEIPLCLREIGRLRETTFRKVGEGTGKPCDLDGFDNHYQHLFLYHRGRREIAGAYRLGLSDEILDRLGPKGLYTRTLFKFRPGFLERITPAIELGRSFVTEAYQKSYAPLLLLLRGIAAFVAENPRYRRLFGPVSISSDYKPVSRQLMASYFGLTSSEKGLSALVKPRTPLPCDKWLKGAAQNLAKDLDDLTSLISDVESTGKGVPVLIRQYLKLGGELLCFNIDPDFSDALDGLILVDLLKTEPKQLEKFMGQDGLAKFQAYHAEKPKSPRKCA